MSCWSAKSFVSCIARAVEDQGLDGLETLSVSDEPQEDGVWKKKKKKKKNIGIAQNMRAVRCFGDVPSTPAPSILGGKLQRNVLKESDIAKLK